MKAKAKAILSGCTPALFKLMLAEFGLRRMLESAARAFACVCLLISLLLWLPSLTGWPLGVLAASAVVGIAAGLRAFDVVGQVACASGCIRENLSETKRARFFFEWALVFLRDRIRAYEGLYRIADRSSRLRDVAELITRREKALVPGLAELRGRCFRESGDWKAAQENYELAERLAPSDAIRLELAELYLKTGEDEKCISTLERLGRADINGHAFFLRAKALRLLGKAAEGLVWANRATGVRPCNPDYQIEKGKILQALERNREAWRHYAKAIRVHPQNPEAFLLKATLNMRSGNRAAAVEDFRRCFYYENTCTEAYLLANQLPDRGLLAGSWGERECPSFLTVHKQDFELMKGQTRAVEMKVKADKEMTDCRLVVLEPFGWGVEVRPREIAIGNLHPGQERRVTLEVKAKRASQVNMNRPWVVNVIVTERELWASRLLRFIVTDAEPGRVFLVLTNDHEARFHRERLSPSGECPIDVRETESDLVQKGERANALAENYSLKWTHMLDVGTALELLKWASGRTSAWSMTYDVCKSFYRKAYLRGHDFQVHLHLSGLPQSYFFCYNCKRVGGTVFFDAARKKAHFPEWGINSWANVVPRYGRREWINTRLGSLVLARQRLATLLEQPTGSCQSVLFRAGQWDLGATAAEREKSIMALRETGFLADSSATRGYDCYKKPFRFGAAPSQAVYFTSRNNPEIPARSALEAGILEVVPILHPNGQYAIRPRDSSKTIIFAYRNAFAGGKVKPGRHIVMEIEHLATLEEQPDRQTGRTGERGEWRAIKSHFGRIRRACPALESVGASEAVYSWLDYYSPEIVVRLVPAGVHEEQAAMGWCKLSFALRFLGDGILGDEERVHWVAVPLPVLSQNPNRTVRVCQAGRVLWECRGVGESVVWLEFRLSSQNQGQFVLELENEDKPTSCYEDSTVYAAST